MSVRSELRKGRRLAAIVLFCPIYFLPSLVMRALGFQFLLIRLPDRIGHLVLDIESYVKDVKLGRMPQARPVFLAGTRRIANEVLLQYWRQHIRVVTNLITAWLLQPFMYFPYLVCDLARYSTIRKSAAKAFATSAAWGDRPPLLSLEKDHDARGHAVLRELGIPEGAWFVCIHSRDAGYATHDDERNDYRNAGIETYRVAAEEIVKRGGYCVRVGDISAPPMSPMPGLIDYPRSKHRSAWMDVFLCARCRFFVGSSSGLYLMSSVFGVSVALAHVVPMECALGIKRGDLTILKHMTGEDGKRLSLSEIFGSDVAGLRFSYEFEAAKIRTVENSPEEIRQLVIEMLERKEGTAEYSRDDEMLQERMRALVRPIHYTYMGLGRVGRDFLRGYAAASKN